ncbi:hypothetical protein DYB28_001612 [Aphanomyces astaci]|uniref:peptidylprolyl isomerase n=1 Tax=Aphanomyces astaci TaxID=112090 RepID=A0A397DDQ1_APHAT|nr:hypothetical protein DYB38_002518 [Aphanomyces astaci]RHY66281.1 hypothetical protein DYB34_006355 [Aphanomyces astaci]RLN99869.1 hypothetical protein DYB28_001612 [Aphanomyces astaci]
MNLGEVARFIIKPEYGYGVLGLAPKVEPNETLDYEIELVSFGVRYIQHCETSPHLICVETIA